MSYIDYYLNKKRLLSFCHYIRSNTLQYANRNGRIQCVTPMFFLCLDFSSKRFLVRGHPFGCHDSVGFGLGVLLAAGTGGVREVSGKCPGSVREVSGDVQRIDQRYQRRSKVLQICLDIPSYVLKEGMYREHARIVLIHPPDIHPILNQQKYRSVRNPNHRQSVRICMVSSCCKGPWAPQPECIGVFKDQQQWNACISKRHVHLHLKQRKRCKKQRMLQVFFRQGKEGR